MKLKSRAFGLALVVAATVCLPLHSQQFPYLFGEESTAVQIDPSTFEVGPIMNLTARLGLVTNKPPVADPSKNRVFFLATKFNERTERKGQPLHTQLAVVKADFKGSLGLPQMVDIGAPVLPDTTWGPHDQVDNLQVSPDGRWIFISWAGEKGEITRILDGTTYEKLKEVEKLAVNRRMCVSADGSKLKNAWGNELLVFSIPTFDVVSRINFREKVGKKEFFSKTIQDVVACKMVILEYDNRPAPNQTTGTVYIYDEETGKVTFEMRTHIQGNYFLAPTRNLLVADEEGITPRILEDGKSQGFRFRKIGKLHFFDMVSTREKAVLDVPEEGLHVWISPDQSKLFYFSPRRLAIIDLNSLRVSKVIEVPFTQAQLVFVSGEQ